MNYQEALQPGDWLQSFFFTVPLYIRVPDTP
jgi:hypothetical protein